MGSAALHEEKYMEKIKNILYICFLLVLLTGCGVRDEKLSGGETSIGSGGFELEGEASGEKAAVAEWESTGNRLREAAFLLGDTLYYEEVQRKDEGGEMEVSLFRKNNGQNEAERMLCLTDAWILWYQPDEKGNLYLFYIVDEDNPQYFLRKQTEKGELVYEQSIVPKDMEGMEALATVMSGKVNGEGEICLATAQGDIFFFSSEGQMTGTCKAAWDRETYHGESCGLVNGGKEGIFAYMISEQKEISLRKVNFQQKNLETEFSFSVSENLPGVGSTVVGGSGGFFSLDIFDGYELGVLVSDGIELWQYVPGEGTLSRLFSWGAGRVNLKDYMIDAIGVLEDEFYIAARRSYEDVSYVRVSYKKIEELDEKQKVLLGGIVIGGSNVEETVWGEDVAKFISNFNRISDQYEIELVSYQDIEAFHLELLKGRGPDLICLYALDPFVLTDKGVLEELAPYFAESELVKEEDLLPAIRRAGTIQGKMSVIIPRYSVQGLLMEKGSLEGEGWTVDEFLTLGEENPESLLLDQQAEIYRNMVLHTALRAEMERYVEWDEKCDFDNEEFIALLERIQNLPIPMTKPVDFFSSTYLEEEWERFTEKEYLILEGYVSSLNRYAYFKLNEGIAIGGYADMVPFPNQDAAPYYNLNPYYSLAINSASRVKEGAWAFLEYMLSPEIQNDFSRNTLLPVRVDSFDLYMEMDVVGRAQVEATEEDRDAVRKMVENAYWQQGMFDREILSIINEETNVLWAGDCDAKTAAEKIQRRVSLYISE